MLSACHIFFLPDWYAVKRRRYIFINLRRRCSGVSGNVRPPIHEPLAEAASDDHCGTLRVFDPGTDARVVPEIKLGKVAVQMHLAAMLVNALHATLEDAEIALNRVRVLLGSSKPTYSPPLWLTVP